MKNLSKLIDWAEKISETVEGLTAKTIPAADKWKPVADKLWVAPHE